MRAPRSRGPVGPPDPEERKRLVAAFDSSWFSVRGALELPDDAGVKFGDRVAIYLEGTCVATDENSSRDGVNDRSVVIEAFDGHVIKIIDELARQRRRRKRRRSPSPKPPPATG